MRMIFAGIAAVALGAFGGLALGAVRPVETSTPTVQSVSQARAIVAPGPSEAPVATSKRTAAATPPTPSAAPPATTVPTPKATRVDDTQDKPSIHFDGDRVSVRFGKFKIDF